MHRDARCRVFWRQQAEEARKRKRARGRKREHELFFEKKKNESEDTDDENPDTLREIKIDYKEKDLKREPRKSLPLEKAIMELIQPSLEIRQRFFDPRHNGCLESTSNSVKHSNRSIRETELPIQAKLRKKKRWYLTGCKPRERSSLVPNSLPKRSDYGLAKRHLEIQRPVKSDSTNLSECSGVCSDDSHICLAGITLAAEDREKLEN